MALNPQFLEVINYVNDLQDSFSGLKAEISRVPNIQNLEGTPKDIEDDVRHYLNEIHKGIDQFDPSGHDNDQLITNIKKYSDELCQGNNNTSSPKHLSNAENHLPRLEVFYELFSWLDRVAQTFTHESFPDLDEQVKEVQRLFERQLRPVINALQNVFEFQIKRNLANNNIDLNRKLGWLYCAIHKSPEKLSRIGIDLDTQERLGAALLQKLTDAAVFESDEVKTAFMDLTKVINDGDLEKIQSYLNRKLELYKQNKNKIFQEEFVKAISFALDPKKPITIPQKIVQLTREPPEQKIALEILKSLKNHGVNFSGRDKTHNTCLHLLKSWHEGIAKFLVAADPDLKFALNSEEQSPQDLFTKQFNNNNDPYYDETTFRRIADLLKTPFDE